jgi:hypothetical protein
MGTHWELEGNKLGTKEKMKKILGMSMRHTNHFNTWIGTLVENVCQIYYLEDRILSCRKNNCQV